MASNLMKHSALITKRRLIIIFLLCTIATVSVMTGFSSGLHGDNTIYSANGERMVMWAELPESGTPSDYNALDSVRFAAQKLYTASYFYAESEGDAVANVGMGIRYAQHVHNIRVKKDNEIFAQAISSSVLKSVADQLYFKDETVLFRPATSIKGDSAKFADNAYLMDTEEYYNSYGSIPNEITKFFVRPETILSIVDDNAQVKAAANAEAALDGDDADASDDASTLDVPESLTPDADGNYSVTMTLEPTESSKFYRNEVRTRGGADQNPVYYSVTLKLVIASDFTPISLNTIENYDIAIPGLGAMNCTSNMTEVYSDVGGDGELPEHDFFTEQLEIAGDIGTTTPDAPKSPADYLGAAFAEYIDGSKALELKANISIPDLKIAALGIDGLDIKDLYISVDISTLDIRAKLDGLFVGYSGDNVYLDTGNVKGYIPVSAITELINSPSIKALIPDTGLELPDFGALLEGDMLTTVFENCELTVTDGIACIHMPFELCDGITIDASLYINNADKSLISISGKLGLFGINISISAEPATTTFPALDASFADLSSLLDYVPAAIDTITGGPIRIDGSLSVDGTKIGADMYVDLTDISSPVVDGTVTALGTDIKVTYIDGTIYLEIGNIKLSATTADIPELVSVISELMGGDIAMPEIELPTTLDGWLDILGSLDVTDNKLDITLGIAGRISLTVEKNNGLLSALAASASLGKTDIAANFNIARAASKTVTAGGEYISISEFYPAIDAIFDIVTQQSLTTGITLAVDGDSIVTGTLALDFSDGLALSLDGNVAGAAFEIVFANNTAYITIGNVKVSGSINDVSSLVAELDGIVNADTAAAIGSALGMLTGGLGDIDIAATLDSVLGMIKTVTASGDSFIIGIGVQDVEITAVLAKDVSQANVTITLGTTKISVNLTDIATGANIVSPIAADYVQVSRFIALVKPIASLATADGYKFKLKGSALGIEFAATLAIALPTENSGFAIALTDGKIADVAFDLRIIDNTLYLAVENSIAVKCGLTKSELTALVDKLKTAVPELAELLGNVRLPEFDTANISVADIIGAIKRFGNTESGNIAISLDATALGIDVAADIEISTAADGLTVELDGKLFGIELSATLGATVADGALTDIELTVPELASATLAVVDLDAQTIAKPTNIDDYVDVDTLADLVAPVYDLVKTALNAKTISLAFDANLLDSNNSATNIDGTLTVALDEFGAFSAIRANLTLFANTENETNIEVIYAQKVVYLRIENILLSLDTKTDFERLSAVLAQYLPKYLVDEIDKLLGLTDGNSAFGGISSVFEKIAAVAAAQDAKQAIDALLDTTDGDSALKTLLSMIKLRPNGEELTATLFVMGFGIDVTPHTDGDALTAVSLGMNITAGLKLTAEVSELELSSAVTAIAVPDDADKFVSVMDIVELVNNLVNNFTTPDADGNITFEITDFAFDYAPKTIVDPDGNATKADEIVVTNTAGKSALKGKIKPVTTTDADGETHTSYEFAIEAHIDLTIESIKSTYGTLTLSLYVVDGAAYLDYYEGGTGYGERISIDFASVMQMLCSVMQIMDVDPVIIDSLAGDYMTEIDATFFKSMKIAGLDSIKAMIEDLARAIDDGTDAFGHLDKAWTAVKNAGSMENLKLVLEDTKNENDEVTKKGIKSELKAAFELIKGIFPADDTDKTDADELDVPALIHNIATGVTLEKNGDNIKATVDNNLTVPDTATDGAATLEVMQSKHGERMLLDGFDIQNLDVSTAMISGNGKFTAGEPIDDIVVPADFSTPSGNTTYSDFANIKRLVFDLMNTANLGEFEIGTASSDKISVTISLGIIDVVTIDILYDVKVKLIDLGENHDPRYQTVAAIDLTFNKCSALGATVVPNCTTSLYYCAHDGEEYFYINGYRWYNDEYDEKTLWWTDHKTKATYEPITVCYTLDEFLGMFNDISLFMERCLFYLVPLSTNFTIFGVDLQQEIIKAVTSSNSDSSDIAAPTFATVFKGYSYENGKHDMTIGLKELARNKSFSDLYISIVGAGDNDDAETGNLLNNYISSLSVSTDIASVVNLGINASLVNVKPTAELTGIESSGLSTITRNGKQYKLYNTVTPTDEEGYANDDLIADYILNSNVITWTPFETVKSWAPYDDLGDKTQKN